MSAKGKTEPVRVWEAVAARSRFGDDVELTAANGARRPRARARRSRRRFRARTARAAPQLVTLVGVPGIGKSRLVAELFQVVDRDPELQSGGGRAARFRTAKVSGYWALAEIVKAQAGILETDETDAAETKLSALVDDLIADTSEREWIEGHVRPLVGLSTGKEPAAAGTKSEAHSAWRRLLEALAERRAVGSGLRGSALGRRTGSSTSSTTSPSGRAASLCSCSGTARPELARSPSRLGRRQAQRRRAFDPAALTERDGAAGWARCSSRRSCRPRSSRECSAHAEGNPLYAEEYVRMLQDRGFLVHRSGAWRLSTTAS